MQEIERGLERIERARADIAEHNAERGKPAQRQSGAGDVGRDRFVDFFGGNRGHAGSAVSMSEYQNAPFRACANGRRLEQKMEYVP